MAAVTDWAVREYFEALGYLVAQPRKYSVPGRQKVAAEEIDLIVYHPLVKEHKIPEKIVWTGDDLQSVARAIVAVRGWHTERFYASTIEQTPDILRFVEPDVIKSATKTLGSASMAKILCLPKLPATGEFKRRTIQVLREKGVDGIISFETILAELVDRVDIKKNYEKSDLLQVIRLLKNYGLIKERQLDLFTKKRSRRAAVPGKKSAQRGAEPAAGEEKKSEALSGAEGTGEGHSKDGGDA